MEIHLKSVIKSVLISIRVQFLSTFYLKCNSFDIIFFQETIKIVQLSQFHALKSA